MSILILKRDLLTRHDRLSHQQQDGDDNVQSALPLSWPTGCAHRPTATHLQLNLGNGPHVAHTDDLDAASSLQQLQSHNFGGSLIATMPSAGSDEGSKAFMQDLLRPLTPDVDASTSYAVDDFASFLDSISLPNNPFSPTFQPLPYFSPEEHTGAVEYQRWQPEVDPTPLAALAEGAESGLSRYGSRLPSIQPEEIPPRHNPTPKPKPRSISKVSPRCRECIAAQLHAFQNVVEDTFVLPSRHALSRYIAGYMTGFHEHYPVLHIPTLSLESASVELVLAIAALGAMYCREREHSVKLFQVGKAVALERVRRRSPRRPVETIQALLLLIAVASWSECHPSAREALSIRSVLDWLVREEGLEQASPPIDDIWESWVQFETIKRTILVVFCFFNLHTIVFDIPPMILASELVLSLPCTESEWKAENENAWREIRTSTRSECTFQCTLQMLFNTEETDVRRVPCFSSLGGYILIHAVIQHIWLLQQAARLPPRRSGTLSLTEVTLVEQALKRWRNGWELDREASIGPLSPLGPLSFTSTALLRLAYIRINIDTGSVRSLSTWDPQRIATSMIQSPPIQRSEKMTRAALHCAHGLSIPIKIGINYVAHTQVFFWSNQHALCSLECALLLSKWLEAATVPNPQPALTRDERRLIDFVMHMVAETEYDAPPETLFENNKKLSAIIVRVWATLFRPDSIWEMVDLIGRSLTVYADLLEGQPT